MLFRQSSLIKPCLRFSRTRLSDALHQKACAYLHTAVVGTLSECFLQFRQKGGYPFSLLDGLKAYAVYPGAPFAGTDKGEIPGTPYLFSLVIEYEVPLIAFFSALPVVCFVTNCSLSLITRTSSVMSIPTGHHVIQRPQPTQPDVPN